MLVVFLMLFVGTVVMMVVMHLTIRSVTVVPAIAVVMQPFVERIVVTRIGSDTDFNQDARPAMTTVTVVIVTHVLYAATQRAGNLQRNTHIAPIITAAAIIFVQRTILHVVLHAKAPSVIGQLHRRIAVGASQKQRNTAILRKQRTGRKQEQQDKNRLLHFLCFRFIIVPPQSAERGHRAKDSFPKQQMANVNPPAEIAPAGCEIYKKRS